MVNAWIDLVRRFFPFKQFREKFFYVAKKKNGKAPLLKVIQSFILEIQGRDSKQLRDQSQQITMFQPEVITSGDGQTVLILRFFQQWGAGNNDLDSVKNSSHSKRLPKE